MTAEYLLEAMGLLDDDLIQEADRSSAPAPVPHAWARRWGSLAACLALILALGYGLARSGMDILPGQSVSGSAAASAACGSADSASAAADAPANPESSGGAGSYQMTSSLPSSFVYMDQGDVYTLTGTVVEALPEDCQPLGVLSPLSPDGPSPATDAEEYAGCTLWAEGRDAAPAAVYVQLPGGGYAVAELVQP